MKNVFPKDFEVIDFFEITSKNNFPTIAVAFTSEKDADIWQNLLKNEPYSFTLSLLDTGYPKLEFRFTNAVDDYVFYPARKFNFLLQGQTQFYIQVYVVDKKSMNLQPYGPPYSMNQTPLN